MPLVIFVVADRQDLPQSSTLKKKKKENMHAVHARATFLGGWINWNMVSDVYIFTKGKSNNPAKNKNV